MQATHLSKPKFAIVHTSKTHLKKKKRKCTITIQAYSNQKIVCDKSHLLSNERLQWMRKTFVLHRYKLRLDLKFSQNVHQPHMANVTYFFPGLGTVGLPGSIHSPLILSQVDQGDGQTGIVRDVVVQQLGCLIHLLIKAPISNLEDNSKNTSISKQTFKNCKKL